MCMWTVLNLGVLSNNDFFYFVWSTKKFFFNCNYFGYVSWNIHLPHRQQIRKKEIVREYSFSAYLLHICVENTTNEKHLGGRWSFSRYRVLLHPELIMLPSIVTPWKYKCYKILLISSVIPSPSHQPPDGTQKYCILCKFVNVNITSKECKAR